MNNIKSIYHKLISKQIFLILSLAFIFTGLLTLSSCNKDNDSSIKPDKIADYGINIKETSGLAFGPGKNTLLTVSDNTGKIYELDLKGNILRTLSYKGDDLEGVTFNDETMEIAVVEERKRQIVIVDYNSGTELRRYDIDIEENDVNKGLEGISWNRNNGCYYIVNEKNPSSLLVWKENEGIINRFDLNLGSDNSGIFVDDNNSLWILSDESQTLYKCNLNGEQEESYSISTYKPEGVVVDTDKGLIYIVRDLFSKLFIYKFDN